jgi:hypothetical protein
MYEIANVDLVNRIFREVLPDFGYKIRESQVELATKILETLQEGKISLCEAEVGTGKTHAHIMIDIKQFKLWCGGILPLFSRCPL